MSPDALLEHAAALLKRVLRFEQPADGVLSAYFREHHALGGRERATLAETAYAVVRRRPLLQHLAASGRGPLERRLAILGWQGEAKFLRAGLSADERAWLEQAQAVDPSTLPERLRHNLPEWLAERLRAALGDEFAALVDALDRPAPLDLRVNALRARREQVQHELAAHGIESVPTRWAPQGLRVTGKPALQTLEVFRRGDVEVQDEGSQLVAALVGARRGEMVVDFCAGAGGKTLALGVDMRSTGRLYAFDTSGHRLAALKPRLARSGLSNVYPVQIAHERDERIKRLAGKIDRVLVDAPCSGLGTLRRNPDLKWRQTPGSIAEMRVKQEAILLSAAALLKPGGRLVYATCSLLEQENEEVATAFDVARSDSFVGVAAEDALDRARVPEAAGLVRGPYLRLWPHRHATDGFFAAVWERR
ncbi:MAG TPA: RsmB/NOP family class I SAM-dependent RNA methyltransferase [Caldimonas sp.]|nr:RsmB/NOP family class I SAM-dependent RNA methyltransferase [Caldimonas sp.]